MMKRPLLRAGGLSGFVLVCMLLLLTQTAVHADLLNLKLSAPLQPHTYITNIQISPNGQYALFTADMIAEDAYELYSVPIDGSEPPTLLSSGLLPTGSGVIHYAIAPNNSRVVYAAEQDTAGVTELYSVPLTGGPITKLNPPITVADGNIDSGSVRFSPDSSRVVFMTDWQIDNAWELFSVPAGGGTAVRLNGDLPVNGTLAGFEITPDSSRVVYVASQDSAAMTEVYVVPITGGNHVKLNSPLVAGGFVWMAKISPDGNYAVYTAEQDVDNQWEIYSVALTNPPGAPVQLNPPLGANSDVIYNEFRISPDSSQVVYISDGLFNGVNLYYSVPTGGGPAVQLTQLASGAPWLGGGAAFEITPDSTRLVYRVTYQGAREIFSVPLAGGTPVRLNDALIENGDVEDFQISPDSSRVVYQAHQSSLNSQELYSVPVAGGPVAKLNSALPWLGNVVSYQISADSQRVIYVADQQVHQEYEIFSVPLADGDITKLNPTLVEDGWVHLNFQISPNSNHVVYAAEQEILDVSELFVTFEETPPPPADLPHDLFIPSIQN